MWPTGGGRRKYCRLRKLMSVCCPGLLSRRTCAGKISAEGAKATDLKPGTPVEAGAGEPAAGETGMGIVASRTVSATIRTCGVVFCATDRPGLAPKGRLHTF